MSETLEFAITHNYPTTEMGITIPIILRHGDDSVEINTKLDTGASFSIFRRSFGELLNLDVESGVKQGVDTVTGSFNVFGHEVTIITFGVEWDATVYFFEDEAKDRNVLGRTGWLDRIRLGIIDYECKLLLSYLNE